MKINKPNFLYIGPDKSGSTWLFRVLSQHPECYIPPCKDIYFFDRYYHFGMDWYYSFFKKVPPGTKAMGEFSHDYLFSSLAAERIKRHLPEVRLLVTLREPVERAFSHYLYMVRSGLTRLSFEKAIKAFPEILEHSQYDKYIAIWCKLFDHSQIKIMLFDTLKSNPELFIREILEFLNLPLIPSLRLSQKVRPAAYPRIFYMAQIVKWGANRIREWGLPQVVGLIKHSFLTPLLYKNYNYQKKPTPSLQTRLELKDIFFKSILYTQDMTGMDLSLWLNQNGNKSK